MPERSFYLIVRGWGSWAGGTPLRTYKAGVHEIGAEVAETVLAWKEQHPGAAWLVLSDVRPELEDGSLIGLLPEHLPLGTRPKGVRPLRTEEEPAHGAPSPEDRDEARLVYACPFCRDRFPSAAAAKRHLRHNHVLQPDKAEARVRAHLDAEREQRNAKSRADAGTNDSERWSSGSGQ